jgi:hypothetical protein
VVGDEPYVSLHFLGADRYAKQPPNEALHLTGTA